MKSKSDIRKQLEADMLVFLAQGKQIQKVKPAGSRKKNSTPKEKTVEIEIDFLPQALREKHFAE